MGATSEVRGARVWAYELAKWYLEDSSPKSTHVFLLVQEKRRTASVVFPAWRIFSRANSAFGGHNNTISLKTGISVTVENR